MQRVFAPAAAEQGGEGRRSRVVGVARGEASEDDDVLAVYRASWTSAEYAEGVAAFLAKRPPDFRAARARRPQE